MARSLLIFLFLLCDAACATRPPPPPPSEAPYWNLAAPSEPEEVSYQRLEEAYQELLRKCQQIYIRTSLPGMELQGPKWSTPLTLGDLEEKRKRILDSFRDPVGMSYLESRLHSAANELDQDCIESSLNELRGIPNGERRER